MSNPPLRRDRTPADLSPPDAAHPLPNPGRRAVLTAGLLAGASLTLAGIPGLRSAAASTQNPAGGAPDPGAGRPSPFLLAEPDSCTAPGPTDPAPRPLRILFMGGTIFLGPPAVEYALARGHHVTLFNRGRSNPHWFNDVPADRLRKLRGDRKTGDLESLRAVAGEKPFDAIIDTSAYFTPDVAQLVEALGAENIARYVMVSTINVYAGNGTIDADENDALVAPSADDFRSDDLEHYGPGKCACEKAALRLLGDRCALVRPALIGGPRDASDRLTYWPWRISQGGPTLLPEGRGAPIQVIDNRDLGRFLVTLAESKHSGAFNAVGSITMPWHATMGELVRASLAGAAAAGITVKDFEPIWADADFLAEQNVGPWMSMPAWVPHSAPGMAGFARRSGARAASAGLTRRPLEETCRDLLKWLPGSFDRREKHIERLKREAAERGEPAPKLPDPRRLRAGLTREREAEVLAAWAKATGGKR
ncbi:MAG: epimerase [Phycisphaerales bacterium]|jgi:2'-hydroxyisoflavone reductase|nr:hypothetical protein [Phycisphaeraceae bacterium]